MILIALGSNLSSSAGNPSDTIRTALQALAQRGIYIVARSNLYRTPAWPNPDDPPFVNAVVRVRTDLAPDALLAELHAVEAAFGRTRGARNAPRTLDLDLIDYDGRIQEGPPRLPHPRMEERAFVLVPLRDVAPDWHHPITGKSANDLIAALPDAQVERVSG